MPHKQDYEMFGAGDDIEIPRNNQEQLVIPVGNYDSACHTFTIIYYASKNGSNGMTSMHLTSRSQTFHPLFTHCWIQVFGQQDRQCEFSYLVPVYWCVSEFDTDIIGSLTPAALRIRLLMAGWLFLQSV